MRQLVSFLLAFCLAFNAPSFCAHSLTANEADTAPHQTMSHIADHSMMDHHMADMEHSMPDGHHDHCPHGCDDCQDCQGCSALSPAIVSNAQLGLKLSPDIASSAASGNKLTSSIPIEPPPPKHLS